MCVGVFNETNLIMFAQWLVAVLVAMPNTVMNIERRSSGVTIIDYLLMILPQRNIDPFMRLFNWVVNDPQEHRALYEEVMVPMRRRKEDIYVRAKKYFGFATSGSGKTSRDELYGSTLMNACKRCHNLIRDRSLTEQITGLVIRNGRIDHDVGGHDDLVIGFLLTHWMLTMGKNLQHYNINALEVLVEHRTKQDVKPEKLYFQQEQERIRIEIEELYDRMMRETDENVIMRHESRMRYLNSKLVLEDGEIFSIDAILNDLASQKKARRNTSNNSWYNRSSH